MHLIVKLFWNNHCLTIGFLSFNQQNRGHKTLTQSHIIMVPYGNKKKLLYAKGLHYLDKFIRWICATYQFQCVTYPAIHCMSWAHDTLQSYGEVLLNILAKQFQCLMNSVTSIFNCTLGLIHLQTPEILYLKKNVSQGIQNIHKIISYKHILKALCG